MHFIASTKMKNLRFVLIITVVIAALVIAKIKFFPANTGQALPQQQAKPQAVQVTAYVVKPQKLDNKIYISGTLRSNEEVMLMPEVAGKVTGIYFKEGSNVKKGDLLVSINDVELQAQLKKLQLQEKLATEKEARQKKLLAINGISQEEYDVLLTQLHSSSADIEVLRAQIEKSQIKAPFDGREHRPARHHILGERDGVEECAVGDRLARVVVLHGDRDSRCHDATIAP